MAGRPTQRAELAAAAALFLAVPLAYLAATDHVWEDYFITFRHARNLAEGRGLVYHEGERVHGFTSPLGTLLPALFHRAAGCPESWRPALAAFRIVGLLAFVGGGLLLLRTLWLAEPAAWPVRLAFAALYAAEIKSVAFSVNGQEAGLTLLFLGAALHAWRAGLPRRWPWLAAALAGLQWTRPDGCVVGAAACAAGFLFLAPGRREAVAPFLKAGTLAAAAYLPWVAWTWWYYGSPVPQTVVAKAGLGLPPLSAWPAWGPAAAVRRLGMVFAPVYHELGGWDLAWRQFFPWLEAAPFAGRTPAIPETALVLGVVAALAWLVPARGGAAAAGRAGSLLALLLAAYQSLVLPFPWYFPPLAAGASLALAALPWALAARLPPPARAAMTLAGGGFAAAFLAMVAWLSTAQLAVQQREIEYGLRQPLGEWLRERVRPGESVYLECLGYVGYFSGARMLDWPGLVAPEVVRARRRCAVDSVTEPIPLLEPDWVVLRAEEYRALRRRHFDFVADRYEPAGEFDAIDRIPDDLPGRWYPLHDAHFVVLRRKR